MKSACISIVMILFGSATVGATGLAKCDRLLGEANAQMVLYFLYKNSPPSYLTRGGINLALIDVIRRGSHPERREELMNRLREIGIKKGDYVQLTGHFPSPRAVERLVRAWYVFAEPWSTPPARLDRLIQMDALQRADHALLHRSPHPETDAYRNWKNLTWSLMLGGPLTHPHSTLNLLKQDALILRSLRVGIDAENLDLIERWNHFDGPGAAEAKRSEIGYLLSEMVRDVPRE